jgi:DNA-binding NarL/FixJ family response regulator
MLRILLVEDSLQDRQILRYLLQAQFKGQVEISEAQTLFQTMKVLETKLVDCIVLDLQLPDSSGKETFETIYLRFPDVPIIVMTNNRDQALAMLMIQEGAADYVLKNYTDEEDIFRRIVFAIEKHRRTVRVSPEDAQSYHRLERKALDLRQAQAQEDPSSVIRNISIEVASATADLSRRMFAELQQITSKLVQYSTQQDTIAKTVASLDQELLRGYPDRPSVKSQMELLNHRVSSTEAGLKEVKGEVNDVEDTQRREALQVVQVSMTNRTKILIAVLALLGVVATSATTYFATTHKPSEKSAPK